MAHHPLLPAQPTRQIAVSDGHEPPLGFTQEHEQVLFAKERDLGPAGLFVLPKKVFGEMAPIWYASWSRDNSTAQDFYFHMPNGMELHTHNQVPAQNYDGNTARLDALSQDVFVSILYQATTQRTSEVFIPRHWIFEYLNWNCASRYPFKRIVESVNKLNNTLIYQVNPNLSAHEIDPVPIKLLSYSVRSREGIGVKIPEELMRSMAEMGTWGIGGGVDYVRISQASKEKSRNQIAKLIYLMLRSHEYRRVATVPLEWIKALSEWHATRQRYNYTDLLNSRSRVARALHLLHDLQIIENVSITPRQDALTCVMKPQTSTLFFAAEPRQVLLPFADPAGAIVHPIQTADIQPSDQTEVPQSGHILPEALPDAVTRANATIGVNRQHLRDALDAGWTEGDILALFRKSEKARNPPAYCARSLKGPPPSQVAQRQQEAQQQKERERQEALRALEVAQQQRLAAEQQSVKDARAANQKYIALMPQLADLLEQARLIEGLSPADHKALRRVGKNIDQQRYLIIDVQFVVSLLRKNGLWADEA